MCGFARPTACNGRPAVRRTRRCPGPHPPLPVVRTNGALAWQPGDFVHVLGDAHVYNNHIDALELQLLNEPRAFPTLRINRQAPLTRPPPTPSQATRKRSKRERTKHGIVSPPLPTPNAEAVGAA